MARLSSYPGINFHSLTCRGSKELSLTAMQIEDEIRYRALAARDARFDGLFFVGVTSTGIYCRPICTARCPGRDRCRFFSNSALAERDGFRPCLRCRPELAPGHAPIDVVRYTARAAAGRIEAGALNDGGSLDELAGDLGMSARQLRRAVKQEFGVSPIELAQTQRLLLAKQLLAESNLPIIKVAFASGFESVRRFNTLFRSHYRLTPTKMRQLSKSSCTGDRVRLTLAYRPPFNWPSMLRFLNSRATAGVEQVVEGAYLRTASVGKHRGWFKVEPIPGRDGLAVEIATSLVPALPEIMPRLKNLFDLSARPDMIASHLSTDLRLADVVNRFVGIRVPGAFDSFELTVRAILGQRVSVRAATTLTGRLAAQYGEPLETPFPGLDRLSPTPVRIALAQETEIASLGIVAARGASIRAIANAVNRRELDLHPGSDPEKVARHLQTFAGIGDWTAQYIAMRALRWPDAFPASDLVLLKATGEKSPKRLRETAEAWRPWRAYAAMYLWESQRPIEEESLDD
jgi:AraC family transcriptional regulator, regulatory protein of adaptative response / DNA-3-methyladenine glycosylase II